MSAAKATMSNREEECSNDKGVMSTQEIPMSTIETVVSDEETVVSTAESTVSKKKRSSPAEQDEAISNFISQSRVTIETILGTPEILALLAPRGYDAAKLNAGLALQTAALNAFTVRQTAMGDESKSNQAVTDARILARNAYFDFREIVRAAHRGQSDRQALGVVGTIPPDTEKLLTQARASYSAAGKPPYSTALSGLGYNPAGLTAALATLDVLHAARSLQETRRGVAVRATAVRNTAVKALREWMQTLKRVAKVALRARPDLQKQL